MATHVLTAEGFGRVTWSDGQIYGDPDLCDMLRRAADPPITAGPLTTGLDGELSFLETCRLVLGETFTIDPPILRDDPEIDY